MVMGAFKKFEKPQSKSYPSAPVVSQSDRSQTIRDSVSHISPFNGGITDKYRWSQTLEDVTAEIPLSRPLKDIKDLSINLTTTGISISHPNNEITLDGTFPNKINLEDSTWMIEDSKSIILSLEKQKKDWWKSLLIGDLEIDTTKVESRKRIDEYDSEAQASIRRIVHDQCVSRSVSSGMEDKLRAAWDAENSPFKGTLFDPSVLAQQSNV